MWDIGRSALWMHQREPGASISIPRKTSRWPTMLPMASCFGMGRAAERWRTSTGYWRTGSQWRCIMAPRAPRVAARGGGGGGGGGRRGGGGGGGGGAVSFGSCDVTALARRRRDTL